MIRVSVSYPRTDGSRFDMEYYKNNHMPLVKSRLAPLKVEIDAGVPDPEGSPSPYIAVGYMTFESMDQFLAKFAAAAQDLLADIPNYTDIAPTIQLSEIIEI